MNRRTRRVTGALAATALLTLAACGGGGSASTSAKPTSIEEALGLDQAGMNKSEAKVQEAVRKCMQAQGFEYVPLDPSQQQLVMVGPGGGHDDKEFRATKGYGISTVLGEGPEPNGGANTDPNQKVREALSEDDRKAYDRALFGVGADHAGAGGGFVVQDGPIVTEGDAGAGAKVDGGCFQAANRGIRKAMDKLGPKLDDMEQRVNSDPRMVKANAKWSACMGRGGFRYDKPQDIPNDLFERMNKIMGGSDTTGPLAPPNPDDPALAELQRDELALAKADDECAVKTKQASVAKKVRAEAERRFLEENPDFGAGGGAKGGGPGDEKG